MASLSGVEIFLIAFGVFAFGLIVASTYTSEIKRFWRPIFGLSLIARGILVAFTLWLALSAGGIAFIFGLIAVFIIAIHVYLTRPDEDVGVKTPNALRRLFRMRGRK